MDYFDKTKKSMLEQLYKPDKSFKGTVDDDAIPVINEFNSKKDYYTTSSCSGRISLFYESSTGKKHEAGWQFVEHRIVTTKEILESLKELPEETLWFKMETPIFHIACRDENSAEKLLELCRNLGFKRSGIISTGNSSGKRIIIEIIFNDKIEVPVAMNGELFVDEKFIKFVIEKANSKFLKNKAALIKFEKELQKV
ncbi:MAG: tRNA wybutosine-synthesizing 3 family protein [Candidatus Woesearchaeota archaeon]|jgi:tRNA wybutosine-synthesizing protein 3